MNKVSKISFTGYEKFVIYSLSFLQFTIILDFMVLSPLGAMLIPALNISPKQFGIVVSGYAFSAGFAGILAGGFADRFDRKKLLLGFYAGFLVGTLLCGLATSYEFLLVARIVTGIFGGVIGSIAFAIVTDLFAFEVRGRVMGMMGTAFAASQVLGIPLSLFLATRWGWHAPFFMIVGVGVIAGIFLVTKLKPINAHVHNRFDTHPFLHLWQTCTNAKYAQAFVTTALLSTGGFMLMPFASAFSVHNLGIPMEQLPWIYLCTGASSIIMFPMIGRAADVVGKFKIFMAGTLLSIAMVTLYTHLGPTPLWELIVINVVLFTGIFSRVIPAQALMSAIPEAKSRGSFMAISGAVQQIAGGAASAISGMIVVQNSVGGLEHFDRVGYVVSGAAIFTAVMMFLIDRKVQRQLRNTPTPMPHLEQAG